MKKKLIITALLLGTFTFANAQSMGDITKAANTATKTATSASTFDVAAISNQVMGLLGPKLKLTNTQKPGVTSLVNEILNKKKNILPTKKTDVAGYNSKMTATRESFLTKIKKLITPAQLQALTPLLPKSAQSLTPLAQMLF
ncbi:hypothetical protein [Flavobacterium aquicola]|uniref:Uncharacterized protein n=1 Tax=Flavobacterium aquicola TaxID=1682742 RepID=A0A3E0EUX6_9FLAO|nr:hypothetical protein [Flavobacterium aquicola]REH01624.1 hypothetical protein C8P67_101102 [Flavobacterium aquicola]